MLSSRPSVVVGVDGTAAGKEALRVGLREATLRGCAVEVVTCWQPATWYGSALGELPEDILRRAQQAQEETVSAALTQSADRPVISRRVIEGPAGPTLVKLSKDAELLVVGTHHKNVVERSVLGSVSEHCIRHAECPVVVVPTAERSLVVSEYEPQ